MANDNIYSFNLSTILQLGDFDIRAIAADNESLTSGEYFAALSKYLDDSPVAIEALSRVGDLSGGKQDFAALEDMAALLSEIGCSKPISTINVLIEAGRNGSREFAAACAKKVLPEFDEIYKRARTARKKSKQPQLRPSPDAPGQLLSEALELADRAEATRKMRILAVDDTAFMLKMISSVLSDRYEVFALTKSTMVESFLRNTTPELFLLDFNMPDISGVELVPIIRSFEEHKDTPIIFLTAMGTAEHVSAAMSAGACDYIIKPPVAEVLREKIENHIIRKKSF